MLAKVVKSVKRAHFNPAFSRKINVKLKGVILPQPPFLGFLPSPITMVLILKTKRRCVKSQIFALIDCHLGAARYRTVDRKHACHGIKTETDISGCVRMEFYQSNRLRCSTRMSATCSQGGVNVAALKSEVFHL